MAAILSLSSTSISTDLVEGVEGVHCTTRGLATHLALSTDFLVSLPGLGRWLAASRCVSCRFALE